MLYIRQICKAQNCTMVAQCTLLPPCKAVCNPVRCPKPSSSSLQAVDMWPSVPSFSMSTWWEQALATQSLLESVWCKSPFSAASNASHIHLQYMCYCASIYTCICQTDNAAILILVTPMRRLPLCQFACLLCTWCGCLWVGCHQDNGQLSMTNTHIVIHWHTCEQPVRSF